MNRPARALLLTITASLAGWASPGWGAAVAPGSPEAATRRMLIDDARAAHKAGDHAKALELSVKALAIEATPSLRQFVAQEKEETGALAEAFAMAQQCKLEAQRDRGLRNRDEILAGCAAIEGRLRDRVGYVVVDVPTPPEGLKVKLGGRDVNEAMLGIPYVITPGTVSVEASAPGRTPFRLEISVSEGKTVNVSVMLSPASTSASCPAGQQATPTGECVADTCQLGMVRAEDGVHCCWPGQTFQAESGRCAGAAACPPGTLSEGDGCVPQPAKVAESVPPAPHGPDLTASPAERAHRAPYGLFAMGVGGVVLAGGGIAWLIADSEFSSAKTACNGKDGCSQSQYDGSTSKVRNLDRVAVGALIGGGVLVIGGGLYHYLSGRSDAGEAPSASRVALDLDPWSRVIGVRGAF